MEITGKCKAEFEKWFTNSDNHQGFDAEQIALDRKYRLKVFYQLYPSMQYGVYVDFFDSVGINSSSFSHYEFYKCNLDNTLFHTRPEARTAAIEKANELYNERY